LWIYDFRIFGFRVLTTYRLKTYYMIGALGGGSSLFGSLQPQTNIGLFSEMSPTTLAQDIASAIALPGRYPERLPIDDIQAICG